MPDLKLDPQFPKAPKVGFVDVHGPGRRSCAQLYNFEDWLIVGWPSLIPGWHIADQLANLGETSMQIRGGVVAVRGAYS